MKRQFRITTRAGLNRKAKSSCLYPNEVDKMLEEKQREEFKKQLLSDVSDELDPLLLRIQRYATNLLQGITGLLSPEQRDHLRTIIDCVEELKTILCKLRDASLSASERLRAEQQWVAAADLAGQSLATVLEQVHRKRLHTTGGEDRDLPFALCDPESFLNKI